MNKDYQEAFEKTKIAGTIAAGALNQVDKIIKPGISTDEIDKVCYEYINDNNTFGDRKIPNELQTNYKEYTNFAENIKKLRAPNKESSNISVDLSLPVLIVCRKYLGL